MLSTLCLIALTATINNTTVFTNSNYIVTLWEDPSADQTKVSLVDGSSFWAKEDVDDITEMVMACSLQSDPNI